jgi:hypothetical protein
MSSSLLMLLEVRLVLIVRVRNDADDWLATQRAWTVQAESLGQTLSDESVPRSTFNLRP